MAKSKDRKNELAVVIYNLLEGLRIVSGLIYPVMPDTALRMQQVLGLDPGLNSAQPFFGLDVIGTKNGLPARGQLLKPMALFPRVAPKKEAEDGVNTASSKVQPFEIKSEISYDNFSRIDLRVATVVQAETIAKAKKLLKLVVDMGGEKRTIVAGISKTYTPSDLVGKQVIVVANLKPVKLMGITSEGMLLAAVEKTGCSLATLDKPMPPGTLLS
jgi:methionyl-tRNA synthetase